MTPKEEASKLRYQIERTMVDADMFGHYDRAIKELAFIVVNKIIDAGLLLDSSVHVKVKTSIEYWEQVKQEIESL